MKNFGEKEAWAYPGNAQFFGYRLLSQERGKLRISNFTCTCIYGLNRNKSPLKIRESSRGRCQGLWKIFRAAMHRAHRAVIFAITQLSCSN